MRRTVLSHSIALISLLLALWAAGSQVLADEPPPAWLPLEQQARASLVAGQLDAAEQQYKEALSTAERAGAIEPGLVTCLVGLAYVNDKKGNPQESERLYELAMRNMEGLVGPTNVRFADWLPDLAFLYDSHGKPDKAEVLFKRAWRIKQDTYGGNDVRVAEVLEQYARFLRKNGRQVEAADLETRAHTIRQKNSSSLLIEQLKWQT